MELTVTAGFILGSLLVGAISPGPSFVLVAKLSMRNSRKDGVAASIGMGIGGAIFSILALLGLHTVLTVIPAVYFFLKVSGGVYLVYLAFLVWRGAKETLTVSCDKIDAESALKKSFLMGLATQLSNPKTAIVYGSIFAAFLPTTVPGAFYYILPPLVFLIEAGWYLVVSVALSSSTPRSVYLRSKSLFDRMAGGLDGGPWREVDREQWQLIQNPHRGHRRKGSFLQTKTLWF